MRGRLSAVTPLLDDHLDHHHHHYHHHREDDHDHDKENCIDGDDHKETMLWYRLVTVTHRSTLDHPNDDGDDHLVEDHDNLANWMMTIKMTWLVMMMSKVKTFSEGQ